MAKGPAEAIDAIRSHRSEIAAERRRTAPLLPLLGRGSGLRADFLLLHLVEILRAGVERVVAQILVPVRKDPAANQMWRSPQNISVPCYGQLCADV